MTFPPIPQVQYVAPVSPVPDLPSVPVEGEEPKRIFDTITSKLVTVTPELAAEWLRLNVKNRTLRIDGANTYGQDMKDGRWAVTGDAIKFDWFGHLIDGQHRLRACVVAGVSFESFVTFGLDPESQKRMDIGIIRRWRDMLHMEGADNAQIVPALTRRALLWSAPHNMRTSFRKSYKPSRAELEVFFDSDPLIAQAAAFANEQGRGRRSPVSPSLFGFLYWLFVQANEEAAPVFMESFALGTNLGALNPIFLLRERVGTINRNNQDSQIVIIWLTAVAWNRWMDGRQLTKIQLPDGGISEDNFPVLRRERSKKGFLGDEG